MEIRKNSNFTAALLLSSVFVALSLFVPAMAMANEDREIARLLLDAAIERYSVADREQAELLIDRSLDYMPLSDSVYLQGRIRANKGDELRPYYERALQIDDWTRFSPADALATLITLYYRTGAYSKLVDSFDVELLRGDRDALFFFADSLNRLGQTAEAYRFATVGSVLFNDDARFWPILFSDREVVERFDPDILLSTAGDRDAALSAILQWIAALPADETRRDAIDRYLEQGGNDPLVALLLIETRAIDGENVADGEGSGTGELRTDVRNGAEQASGARVQIGANDAALPDDSPSIGPEAIALFRRLDGYADKYLLDRMYEQVADEAIGEQLRVDLGDYSGEMVLDIDRNGSPEERYFFEAGRLVRWNLDRNRDNLLDTEIEIAPDLRPTRLAIVEPDGGRAELIYRLYPDAGRVAIAHADGSRRLYVLDPGGFSLPLIGAIVPELDTLDVLDALGASVAPEASVASEAFDAPGAFDASEIVLTPPPEALYRFELIAQEPLLDEERLLKAAISFERYGRDGSRLVEALAQQDGLPLYSMLDEDEDGQFDYFIRYRQGEQDRIERDIDADGLFESLELYERDGLVRLLVDLDDDSSYDFLHRIESPELKIWIDALAPRRSTQEERLPDGVIERRYGVQVDDLEEIR